MKYKKFVPIILILGFYGCIGTDIVDEIIVPVNLSISRTTDSIQLGNSFRFEADYFNEFGQIEPAEIKWFSSDPSIISINSAGEGEGLAIGSSYLRAEYLSLVDSVKVVVGINVSSELEAREGVFMGNRNYIVNGTFSLAESGNNLVLTFDSNFVTSNGPGLYVYLSNSTSSTTGGIEMGKLKSNSGTQNYTVSMNEAQLGTYRHVLIYCKPFRVSFGTGTFSN